MGVFINTFIYAILDLVRYALCYRILFRTRFVKSVWKYILSCVLIGASIQIIGSVFSCGFDDAGNAVLFFEGLLVPILLSEERHWINCLLYPAVFALDNLVGNVYNYGVGMVWNNDGMIVGRQMPVEKGIICIVILMSACFFLEKTKPFEEEIRPNKWQIFMYYLMAIISVVVVEGVGYVTSGQSKDSITIAQVNFGVALSCLIMFILCVWFGVLERKRLEQQYQIEKYEMFAREQQRHIEELLLGEENLRRFRHDIKNQFISIHALGKQGDLDGIEKYCEKVLGKISSINSRTYTNHVTVDAIIDYYVRIAKEQEICITVDTVGDYSKIAHAYEISTILSNLLQNAIEACLKSEKNRWIKLGISRMGNHIYICTKNPASEKPIIENGMLCTTKEDKKNHGMGTKIIKETVKRLNGTVEYQYEDGIFQTVVVL